MAKDVTSTMQWKLDIAQFKQNIQQARKDIQMANAQFKTATSGARNWASSITGLEAKLKQLSTTEKSQKQVLTELEKSYELTKKELGETSPEAQRLELQIEKQKGAIASTQRQIGEYSDKLSDMQQDAKTSESALGKLTEEINDQEQELAKLKQDYANAIFGDNPEEADRLAKEIDRVSSELNDNKQKMSEAEKAADSFDNTLKETDNALDQAGNSLNAMDVALGGLISAGIQKAVEALTELGRAAVEAYKEFDTGADNVIKKTGATGEVAKQLENSYKNVTKSVIGDFGELGNALGEVNTRFGFTGKELENATVSFQKFADVNGTDVTESVRLVSRAMGDAGIEASELPNVLDMLTAASQASGIEVSKLTENLTKYGAPMRALGLTTEESIAIFSGWEKAGVNTEIAFSGMKKAISNWSKDGKDARVEFKKTLDEIKNAPNITEATSKAIEVFGSKAGPDLADAIQNGRFEYEDMLDVIEGSQGRLDAVYEETLDAPDKIALALQGLKSDVGSVISDIMSALEPAITWIVDNFDMLIPVITAVTAAMGYLAASFAIQAAIGAVTKAMTALNIVMAMNPIGLVVAAIAGLVVGFIVLWKRSEKFRNFFIGMWKSIQKAVKATVEAISKWWTGLVKTLKDAWSGVKKWFDDIWNGIKKAVNDLVSTMQKLFSDVVTKIKSVWGTVKGWFDVIWNGIKAAVTVLVTAITTLFTTAVTTIKTVWGTVKGWFDVIWNGIKAAVSSLVTAIVTFFTNCVNAVKNVWNTLTGFVQGIFNGVRNTVSGAMNAVSSTVSNAVNRIKGVWNGITGTVSNVFNTVKSTISNAINGAKNAVFGAVNAMKNFFSGLHFELPKIKVPHFNIKGGSIPWGIGGKGTPPSVSIDWYARGGVIDGARVIGVGEAGAEAVVPLERNTYWIRKVAEEMRKALQLDNVALNLRSNMNSISSGLSNSNKNISNQTIQNITFNQSITSPKPISPLEVYRDTNSLLFRAKVGLKNV